MTRNLHDKALLTNCLIFLPHQQEQYNVTKRIKIHGIDADHGPRNSSRGNATMQKQGCLYQDASAVVSMLANLASWCRSHLLTTL